VWLLVGALGAEIARGCAVIIEADPLGFLVQPTADGDVKVRYLPVVEYMAHGWLIERRLIVEDLLFQAVEPVFIPLRRYGGVGFMVGMVWSNLLAIPQRRTVSRSGWVWRVIWMVWGERAIGAGVVMSQGGSWMGASVGDSFDALYEPTEDICAMGWVRGGAECIVSCRCSR
jgi:hypothetical protein